MQTRLIKKIRCWEFIELTQLVAGAVTFHHHGPCHLATGLCQADGVLLLAPSTCKKEAAGLAAHLHVILQLARDLGGHHWLVYDWEYREWAAAKGN